MAKNRRPITPKKILNKKPNPRKKTLTIQQSVKEMQSRKKNKTKMPDTELNELLGKIGLKIEEITGDRFNTVITKIKENPEKLSKIQKWKLIQEIIIRDVPGSQQGKFLSFWRARLGMKR